MIPEEYRGVRFRQLAPMLRWFTGGGHGTMHESERPRNEQTGQFLDPDGTFVTFQPDADMDIDRQLRIGGLVIEDTNQRRGERAERVATARMAESLTPQAAEGAEGG